MSRVLYILHKCFNGRAISTFTVPVLPVLIISFNIDLNDLNSVMILLDSFLQSIHNFPVVSHNYHCILLNDTLASQY